jgi:hypothetical protein
MGYRCIDTVTKSKSHRASSLALATRLRCGKELCPHVDGIQMGKATSNVRNSSSSFRSRFAKRSFTSNIHRCEEQSIGILAPPSVRLSRRAYFVSGGRVGYKRTQSHCRSIASKEACYTQARRVDWPSKSMSAHRMPGEDTRRYYGAFDLLR